MDAGHLHRRLVASKLQPPQLPDGFVVRPRLLTLLDDGERFTLVAAMPGYGKTVAVRQWMDTLEIPVAWLSVDLLDDEPYSFWLHLIASLATIVPGLDDEPMLLLDERGPDDSLFLSSLIAQLEHHTRHCVVVIDAVSDHQPRATLDQLGLLVDRIGDRVRFVATTRVSVALPLARWRSVGWLTEIREDELRLTDDEAREVAVGVASDVSDIELDAVNRRIDGWPIGVHMALLSGRPGVQRSLGRDDPLLADYLVSEVLDSLTERERDVAMSLSILEWFDTAICQQLVGPGAAEIAADLLERGVFLTVLDRRTGAMQFHTLVREYMEAELGRRRPAHRAELHRCAAELWSERGDLKAAYRHLSAIGEAHTAQAFFVRLALDLVDAGDLDGLRSHVQSLPLHDDVDDPHLALDLALVALYDSGPAAARRWSDRAASLIGEVDVRPGPGRDETAELVHRLDDLVTAISLLDADLDTATKNVEVRRALPPSRHGSDSFEQRFPIVAARVMLAGRRRQEADEWIRRAEQLDGPEIVTAATVPTLRAWFEWMYGRLDVADQMSERALVWLDEHEIGAHHFAVDTLITTGWCRISRGDVDAAAALADRAVRAAESLQCPWNSLQAGFLSARTALTAGDPVQTLRIVDDLRSRFDFESCRPYADRLLGVEVEALAAAGRLDAARAGIASLQPDPRQQVLRARFGDTTDIAVVLGDRAAWPAAERIQAELLLSVADRRDMPSSELVALVSECAESGWVLPFLGLGPRVDRLLRTDELAARHPRMASAVAAYPVSDPHTRTDRPPVALTPREQSLLELLPTHLSYSEMGERLFLSVNTVKSNLKVLYRKLDAGSRSQAVEAGEQFGLL